MKKDPVKKLTTRGYIDTKDTQPGWNKQTEPKVRAWLKRIANSE